MGGLVQEAFIFAVISEYGIFFNKRGTILNNVVAYANDLHYNYFAHQFCFL